MAWPLFLVSITAAVAGLAFYVEQIPFYHTTKYFSIWPGDEGLASPKHLNDSWNLFYHLGGNGPWIPKVSGVVEGGIDPPEGCTVDQIHMMARHGERYPTITSGIRMLELYQRIQHSSVTLKGDLAFTNNWEFITLDPNKHFESLTSHTPYAGTLQAFTTGVKLRTRYQHLIDQAAKRERKTWFWAGDSGRVIETARIFAAGFFGIDWKDEAMLSVIPETSDMGANTLTPGKTCLKYADNVDDFGHDYGARMLAKFRSAYIPPIIARLQKQNPDFVFKENEIYSMQELCGFETLIKGSSLWCDVFSREELEQFEYARDLLHFYKSGPGNPYGATMGWLWLNKTSDLLREGSSKGLIFLSFVHDGDINPMVAALGILPQKELLPTTHVLQNRTWRTSDLVPMGGRLIFERLVCPQARGCIANEMYPNHIYCEAGHETAFVRLNVNDGIVALPNCTSGPGHSCPLSEFMDMVARRGVEVGNFGEVCGLPEYAPDHLAFLHQ